MVSFDKLLERWQWATKAYIEGIKENKDSDYNYYNGKLMVLENWLVDIWKADIGTLSALLNELESEIRIKVIGD